jgi:hypothetical protein
MALLQEIKKLFGPLLDDLDCVSAVKDQQNITQRFFCEFFELVN